MIVFKSIREFCEFLQTDLPARIAAGKTLGLHEAGKIWIDEMRAELGTYQGGDEGFPDWAKLSQATLDGWEGVGGRLEGKIERGYAPPDNPLVASGHMRDSGGYVVEDGEMAAGFTDMAAVWEEDGTAARGVPFVKGESVTPGIPGRSFIARGAFRKTDEAVNAIGAAVVKAMTSD